MHFGHLDLDVLGVISRIIALVIPPEMHFKESVSIISFTDDSPNDGSRTWS